MPAGVMIPVIKGAGVTSNPGFLAPLVGLAIRTCSRLPRAVTPQAPKTSSADRSSIGMSEPRVKSQSIVDNGIAT